MGIKQICKRIVLTGLQRVPFVVWRRVFDLWAQSLETQAPVAALHQLISTEDRLMTAMNALAIRYGQGVHVKHRLTHYHDFFVDRLRPEEVVLDIGCGYGAVAYSMVQRAHAQVTAIDINRKSIETAQRLHAHPNLTLVYGDILETVPSGSFETVVLSNVLEHLCDRIDFLKYIQQSVHPQ
ncbi:MAG: methyltransferase domain-containing protein, partial [Cyanobacteria bacterium J06633_1]